MCKGFTLIELIAVLIIISIMVAFAVPQFAVTKERALDKEAKATLMLLKAAERAYRMEEGSYYPNDPPRLFNNVEQINYNLRVSLPLVNASSPWTYSVNSITEQAIATRRLPGGGGRILDIYFTSDDIIRCAANGDTCL